MLRVLPTTFKPVLEQIGFGRSNVLSIISPSHWDYKPALINIRKATFYVEDLQRNEGKNIGSILFFLCPGLLLPRASV